MHTPTDPEVPEAPEVIRVLANCQHPRQWELREDLKIGSKCFIDDLKIQLDESSLLRIELPFNHLIHYVALAYEYFISNNIEMAIKTVQEGLAELKKLWVCKNVEALRPAFLHVLKATLLFFLIRKKNPTYTYEVASSIPKIEEMDSKNAAAVRHGFPALFIGGFGLEGMKLALDCLTKAVEMDPTESIWYYSRAEFVGQLDCAERLIDKMPSDEQFKLLNQALGIKRAAIYTSRVAGLLRQCAKEMDRPIRILANKSKDVGKIEDYNQKSWKYYNESLQLNDQCPEILYQCARGFLLLPTPYQDIARSKELLDKAYLMAPDSGFGNMVMAEYYKIMKDLPKAMEHFRICEKKKIFGATIALIRLEFQSKMNIDFVERLENLLNQYEGVIQRATILYEITTYYDFILKDLRKACEYADKIMEFGKIGDYILQCRPSGGFCSPGFKRVTLYNILIKSIMYHCNTGSPEDKQYYKTILQKFLSRKIEDVDPVYKVDDVTFAEKSANFSLLTSNDNSWRHNKSMPERMVNNEPALSWRKKSQAPSTANQSTTGSRRVKSSCCAASNKGNDVNQLGRLNRADGNVAKVVEHPDNVASYSEGVANQTNKFKDLSINQLP